MKKTWSKAGEGELPKGHWLHAAMVKEKVRHAKKKTMPPKKKPMMAEEAVDTGADMGEM